VVFESRDDHHVDLLDAVYRAAEEQGFELLLRATTSRRSQEQAVATLVGARVLGIVNFGARRTPRLRTAAQDLPPAVIGSHDSGGADVVRSDEAAGVRAAVEARGLADRTLAGGFSYLAGTQVAQRLLDSPADLPTAVIAADDPCAAGFVTTLRSAGIEVPGRVSVVGFDGTRGEAIRRLDLTTVLQDVDVLADQVVRALSDRAEGDTAPPREHVLPVSLVVGSTTGPTAIVGWSS